MDEELKKKVAVFRYGVIADFVGGAALARGERRQLLQKKCAQKWLIPGSTRSRIGMSTIKEWINRYRVSGNRLESLYPNEREDKGKSRVIDDDTAAGIVKLRKEMLHATLPILVRVARERKIILPGKALAHSTLYRFLAGRGLMDQPVLPPKDRRRFEAESPNDLWQSDVMHGPMVIVDGKSRKSYLTAFIDDHSRLVPHAEFFLSERLDNFLEALRKALLMRGLPRKLYVDNGPAFRSTHLEHICASLGVVLIHAKPYQPEGKGKIERFFRTVRMQLLPVTKETTLAGLNAALGTWISGYHETSHGTIGEPPLRRFTRGLACVRPAPSDLEDHFRKEAKRTVARDRTFTIQGRLYEAPVDLAGKQVRLLYHEHDPARVEVLWEGKTYGFASLLDVNVNCRIKRENGVTGIDPGSAPGRYKGGNLFTRPDNPASNDKEATGL
jgi:transposase InsO family protein